MKRRERESFLRQGVTLPETPRDRRDLEGLAADLEGSPLVGGQVPLRLRNFRPSAEGYLASLGGPLAYMVRLRQIDRLTGELEEALGAAWRELADECGDDASAFARGWSEVAEAWPLDEVNELVERHNRWYPVESRLPMDPARGDYALVNGSDYRRPRLDSAWVLERFPPVLPAATPPGVPAHAR